MSNAFDESRSTTTIPRTSPKPIKTYQLPYDARGLGEVFHSANVSGEVRSALLSACERPLTGLLQHFILPSVYIDGLSYLYCPRNIGKPGRRHYSPEVTLKTLDGATPAEAVARMTSFTNPLAMLDPINPTRPTDRPINVGWVVTTLEFDDTSMGIDPLTRSIGWIRSGHLRRLHKRLKQFHDYAGYSLVYSGGKSPHLHVIWRIRHLRYDLSHEGNTSYGDNFMAEVPDALLVPYHAIVWDRVVDEFRQAVDGTVSPDHFLQSYVQIRRCPWGIRRVEKEHLHGYPVGSEVPQVVLAEEIRARSRGAAEWMFDPEAMLACGKTKAAGRSGCKLRLVEPGWVEPENPELHKSIAWLTRRLIGSEYPKFDRLITSSGVSHLTFFNHSGDRNADSYLKGEHTKLNIVGSGFPVDSIVLPVSADRIVEAAKIAASRKIGDEHPLVDAWKQEVTSNADIRPWFAKHAVEIALASTRVWCRSPEGAGKTTCLVSPEALKTVVRQLATEKNGAPDSTVRHPVLAIAFPSYEQAREKLEQFNRSCGAVNSELVGFDYRSLSRLYSECLDGETEIKDADAFKVERGSRWGLVIEQQPDVWSRMMQERDKLIQAVKLGRIPVLFTVLDVVRLHEKGPPTRWFYAKSFLEEVLVSGMSPNERNTLTAKLREETEIDFLIVDEVSTAALLDEYSSEKVEDAKRFQTWLDDKGVEKRSAKFTELPKWRWEHGKADLSFEEFETIRDIGFEDTDRIIVNGQLDPPFGRSDGLYSTVDGSEVFLKPSAWWEDFPRVVFLTTELAPTLVAKQVVNGLLVLDLQCSLENASVEMIKDRACCKKRIQEALASVRELVPGVNTITNMDKTGSSTTPMAARGLNRFVGSDVASIHTAPSPGHYRMVAAIGTRYGIPDIMRLTMVDQYNQICGRNRGLRSTVGRRHVVMATPRLWSWLRPHLALYGRYDLIEVQEASIRDEVKLAA